MFQILKAKVKRDCVIGINILLLSSITLALQFLYFAY